MRHIQTSYIYKHGWFNTPSLGMTRTQLEKNEYGLEDIVNMGPVESKNKSYLGMAPTTPTIHGTLFDYIKSRLMVPANYNTTTRIVDQSLLVLQLASYKINTLLEFEENLEQTLPLLGLYKQPGSVDTEDVDVKILTEQQSHTILGNWIKTLLQTDNFEPLVTIDYDNVGNKLSILLGSEIFGIELLENSIIIKKRDMFYEKLWDLYKFDEDVEISEDEEVGLESEISQSDTILDLEDAGVILPVQSLQDYEY